MKRKTWKQGMLYGMITGVSMYILAFVVPPAWYFSGEIVCFFTSFEAGESCAFGYIYFGWFILPLIYGAIGALIGFCADWFIDRPKN